MPARHKEAMTWTRPAARVCIASVGLQAIQEKITTGRKSDSVRENSTGTKLELFEFWSRVRCSNALWVMTDRPTISHYTCFHVGTPPADVCIAWRLSTDYLDSPDFYCSEHIRFYFLVFSFTLFSCFRAVD